MSELATHIIAYIDSHTKLNGTDTHFTHTVNLPSRNTFDSACVLQESIPKSFYLIAQNFNSFVLTEPASEPTEIFIPVGNYSRKALALTLASVLNQYSPSGEFTYAVTFPNGAVGPDDGKYLYSVTKLDGSPIDEDSVFSITFGATYQPCEAMGFEIEQKTSSTQWANCAAPTSVAYKLSLQFSLKATALITEVLAFYKQSLELILISP